MNQFDNISYTIHLHFAGTMTDTDGHGNAIDVQPGQALRVNTQLTLPFSINISLKLDIFAAWTSIIPFFTVFEDTQNYYQVYFDSYGVLSMDKVQNGNIISRVRETGWVFTTERQLEFVLTYEAQTLTLDERVHHGGAVVFSSDDGHITNYTMAKPILDRYSAPMTVNVVNRLGSPVYLADDQAKLTELQAAGWEIASHTKTHADLTKISKAQLLDEIQGSKYLLENMGLTIKGIAFPFGSHNLPTRYFAKKYYEYIRPTSGLWHNPYPCNPSMLGSHSTDSTIPLETQLGYMDQAVTAGRLFTPLFHYFATEAKPFYTTPHDLEAIVAHARRKGYPILTWAGVVARQAVNNVKNICILAINLNELKEPVALEKYFGGYVSRDNTISDGNDWGDCLLGNVLYYGDKIERQSHKVMSITKRGAVRTIKYCRTLRRNSILLSVTIAASLLLVITAIYGSVLSPTGKTGHKDIMPTERPLAIGMPQEPSSPNRLTLTENHITVGHNQASKTEQELFQFGVVSDVHIQTTDKKAQQKFSDMLTDMTNDLGVGTLIINGDLGNGTPGDYLTLNTLIGKIPHRPRIYFTIGNHEFYKAYINPNTDLWSPRTFPNGETEQSAIQRFTALTHQNHVYYDRFIAGYHFIFLGSERSVMSGKQYTDKAYLSNAQLDWLKHMLRERYSQNKPIFVFLHQPFPDTTSGSWSRRMQGDIVQKAYLQKILDQYPNVIFFSGHTHWQLGLGLDVVHNHFTMVNDSSVEMPIGVNGRDLSQDSQGLLVKVYQSHVVIQGRDFHTDTWIPDAMHSVNL